MILSDAWRNRHHFGSCRTPAKIYSQVKWCPLIYAIHKCCRFTGRSACFSIFMLWWNCRKGLKWKEGSGSAQCSSAQKQSCWCEQMSQSAKILTFNTCVCSVIFGFKVQEPFVAPPTTRWPHRLFFQCELSISEKDGPFFPIYISSLYETAADVCWIALISAVCRYYHTY